MIQPRRFPTFKRLLFQVHQDLGKIAVPDGWFGHDDLSDLETIVILLEDRRFFQHCGIDVKSVARECWRMVTLARHGGASTIDMQFVRTRTGYRERTLKRKLYEMLLAVLLQYRMSKIEILRAYLNEMYLGSGIFGIVSAANVMFAKHVYELERREAAIVAAMMVYPRPLNPSEQWKAKVDRRAAYGLRLFEKLGGRYKKRFE